MRVVLRRGRIGNLPLLSRFLSPLSLSAQRKGPAGGMASFVLVAAKRERLSRPISLCAAKKWFFPPCRIAIPGPGLSASGRQWRGCGKSGPPFSAAGSGGPVFQRNRLGAVGEPRRFDRSPPSVEGMACTFWLTGLRFAGRRQKKLGPLRFREASRKLRSPPSFFLLPSEPASLGFAGGPVGFPPVTARRLAGCGTQPPAAEPSRPPFAERSAASLPAGACFHAGAL